MSTYLVSGLFKAHYVADIEAASPEEAKAKAESYHLVEFLEDFEWESEVVTSVAMKESK